MTWIKKQEVKNEKYCIKNKHEQHPWFVCAHKCKLQECKYMEMATLGIVTSLQEIKLSN